MKNQLNRRDFMAATAAGICAAGSLTGQGTLPRRTLGRTGGQVSILGFGCGSRFLMYEDEARALEVLNWVIDQGVNYLDTAMSYGNGESESRLGKVMKSRRTDVWLTTKVSERGYDEAMRAIEASLKRLQTDHVDLLHIHSLERAEDLAAIERPDGVLRAIYRARDEKMARFVGMTSHTDAETMKTAIERHDLDCVQMALNAATNTGFSTGFERIALPAAQRKNLGILAMKVMGQEQIVGAGAGKAPATDLLRYSLSLPVATCVVGMPKFEFVQENVNVARAFSPISEGERDRIRGLVAPSAVAFDRFLQDHHDDGLRV